jgi:hypothetical protein
VQTLQSPDTVYITPAGLATNYYNLATAPSTIAGTSFTGSDAFEVEFAVNKGLTNGSFHNGIQDDNFAVLWTGSIVSTTGQNVSFRLTSDDGARLWIDGTLRVDHDGLHGYSTQIGGTFFLSEGAHTIEVRYFERGGGAGIALEYTAGGATRMLTGPMGKDIDVDGDWLVIGAPDAKAYVYKRFGETWSFWQDLTGAGGFGSAVAVGGTKIVVGMPDAPATYASNGQADPYYNLNMGAPGGAVVYTQSGSYFYQDRL